MLFWSKCIIISYVYCCCKNQPTNFYFELIVRYASSRISYTYILEYYLLGIFQNLVLFLIRKCQSMEDYMSESMEKEWWEAKNMSEEHTILNFFLLFRTMKFLDDREHLDETKIRLWHHSKPDLWIICQTDVQPKFNGMHCCGEVVSWICLTSEAFVTLNCHYALLELCVFVWSQAL